MIGCLELFTEIKNNREVYIFEINYLSAVMKNADVHP